MPEYDPNLPHEFTRPPKPYSASRVYIAIALLAGVVLLAFLLLGTL